MRIYLIAFLMVLSTNVNQLHAAFVKGDKFTDKCWAKDDHRTLIDLMSGIIKQNLETVYRNDNYIQTFGCAYEDDDIEQNSIRAVYRAIEQSLRNRKITARDNILGMLGSRPPRPDNLARDFTIYVNLVKNSKVEQARYEIRVLNLEVAPTFESHRSVWTRIITRYAYQDDFKNAAIPVEEASEFYAVMQLAEEILEAAGKGKFKKADELVSRTKTPSFHPSNVSDLVFGDYMTLFSQQGANMGEVRAIFLGKGIYLAKIPKADTMILKFGEESLYGLRLDTTSFNRPSSLFANLQYHAPESILQCLMMRFGEKKPIHISDLL